MRSQVRVQGQLVLLKRRLRCECLSRTLRACDLSIDAVLGFDVLVEIAFAREAGIADVARPADAGVHSRDVSAEITSFAERFPALITIEMTQSLMDSADVLLQVAIPRKSLLTKRTTKRLHLQMNGVDVSLKMTALIAFVITKIARKSSIISTAAAAAVIAVAFFGRRFFRLVDVAEIEQIALRL